MKERPILFSAPMVRAILNTIAGEFPPQAINPFEASKGVTRRVIRKPQPPALCDLMRFGHEFSVAGRDYRSPYGKPGDRLWVRETFAWSGDESIPKSERLERGEVWYRADPERDNPAIRWRPSIFMPRWASRILLEVVDVRAEKLQDITADQILAEGVRIPVNEKGAYLLRVTGKHTPIDYLDGSALGHLGDSEEVPDSVILRAEWAALWDSINAARGFPWSSNPWVWCVSFKRIDEI